MELANGHTEDDYGLVLGLRNSHDKTFPASLALGSQVLGELIGEAGSDISASRRAYR